MTATIVFKVNRPTWDEAEHPRDRLGRFIETGAEVNIWGGSSGTVVRNVGGGRIEVERADGVHVIVHRNYLTVTKRPDGSAPTTDQADAPEAAPPKPATPDAETLPDPSVDSDPTTTGAFQVADFLDSEDPKLADRIRFTSADLHMALTNGVPDDEADERAALFELLDQAAGEHPERAEDVQAVHAAAEADGATPPAVAPSPAPASSQPPADVPTDASDVAPPPDTGGTSPPAGDTPDTGKPDAKQRVGDAFDAVIAQEGADSPQAAMLGAARSMWQGGYGDAAGAALASLGVDTPAHQELADALEADAKRVYAGRDTGGSDEQTRSDGGTPLPTVAPAGVRADQGPGDVLPGARDRGAGSDRGAGTGSGGDTPGGRVDGGPDRPVDLRPADSGVDGDTGVPAPGAGDGPGAGGPERQGAGVGDGGLRRGPAGVGDAAAGDGGQPDQPVGPDETVQRVVYQASSGDQQDGEAPPDGLLESLVGDYVRIVTYNEHGVATDHDSGRFVDIGDGVIEWLADGTTEPFPMDPAFIYRIARVPEPADPGQERLFPPVSPEPTTTSLSRMTPQEQAQEFAIRVARAGDEWEAAGRPNPATGPSDVTGRILDAAIARWRTGLADIGAEQPPDDRQRAVAAARGFNAYSAEMTAPAPSESDWRELGRQAFHDGQPAQPHRNPDVQAALDALPVGSPDARRAITSEYMAGWNEANLAEIAAETVAPTPEAPPAPSAPTPALSRMTPEEQATEFAVRVARAGDEWEAAGRANSATGPSDVTARNLDAAIARWRTALDSIGAEQPPHDLQLTVDAARAATPTAPAAPPPVEPDWRELGRQAFHAGELASPALSPDVQAAVQGLPVGSPEGRHIMAEYSVGWHEANAAAPVPGIAPNPGWGEMWDSPEHPSYTTPDGPVWMFRRGQRVRFYNTDGDQVGPEQGNVAPAAAYAQDQGWSYGLGGVRSRTGEAPAPAAKPTSAPEFYRGLPLTMSSDDPRTKPLLRALATGATSVVRDRVVEMLGGGSGINTWTGEPNTDRDSAGNWWTPRPSVAWTYAAPAPEVGRDELSFNVVFTAKIDTTPDPNSDEVHVDPGTPVLITKVEADLPTPGQAGALLDLLDKQGGWHDVDGMHDPDTWVDPFPQLGDQPDVTHYSWSVRLDTQSAAPATADPEPVAEATSAPSDTVSVMVKPDHIDQVDTVAPEAVTAAPEPARAPAPTVSGTGHLTVGARVDTEFGSGVVVHSSDRSVGVRLDGGDEINVQRGTPGLDRIKPAADAAAPPAPEPDPLADAGEPLAPTETGADQPAPDPSQVAAIPDGGTMFRPIGIDDLAPAGAKAKLNANMEALRTLRALQTEHRPATPDEQATLAKWAGWGGLPEVFDDLRPEYATQREELRTLLSEAEWNEAKRNTLNAHYTDARVVQALWKATEDLGFDGGRVLEPGSGSGTFIGFAPDDADMVGVELDSTTAALSQYLYPDATIRNESFADTTAPDGSFDATVGNVPFGNFALTDRTHNRDGESIHNHFILKSLALTRPGGLVTLLTSRYTLDSQRSGARVKMAEMADLVGAVRLPTGSHQRASGTAVIEDALIFRRREPDAEPQADQSWITSTVQDIDGQQIAVNDYWATHPQNVLGEIHAEKGQFGTGDLIVRGDKDMTTLPAVLSGIVAQAKADGLTATPRGSGDALPTLIEAGANGRHEGNIQVEADGTFTQATSGAVDTIPVPKNQAEELRQLIGLRDAFTALLDAEAATAENTPEIDELRADLNRLYDRYTARYGPVNRFKLGGRGQRITPGQGGFRRDPMSAVVRALENYDPVTGTGTKAAIFTRRAVAPRELRTTADNPADALTLSMDTYGGINLPAIAGMLGVDLHDEARAQLGDLVYETPPLSYEEQQAAHEAAQAAILANDPDAAINDLPSIAESVQVAGGLTSAAEYLSGDVRRKLAVAQAAARADARFQPNVDALQAVIPADLGPDEIDGRLGAAWIDAGTVKAFLSELLGDRYNQVSVGHSGGSIWSVVAPRYGNLATEVWGTDARTAGDLVQSLLEQRAIKVTRKVGDKSVPDLEATLAAQAKAEEIQERFSEWLWEDPDRARVLQARYNEQFNGIVLRSYKGSTRQFPGMSEHFKPHDHVVDAVERIVNEPTALLAHVVGAGKTAEMVMGSAELKRLGLARKPAIVIPNHMLEQFSREYLDIYPNAKILAAGSDDLQGDKRREFVARAATGDWDAIIITKNAFESIPMSPEQTQAYIDREMATMRAQLADALADPTNMDAAQKRTVKKMEKSLIRAEEALKKKLGKTKDVGVSFEQTGIDYLMVDEAHNYSNLRTLSNIQGAGTTGSDLATDLHMKMEYLRQTSTSGRVATFATGTPIRNTVTQAYVMTKFLRPDLLQAAGIHTFDQWAATFGQTVDEMELKPEGTGFRQTTRFAKFRNVPEFLRMFHTFADVKLAEDLNLPTPHLVGGKVETVVVPASTELREYIRALGDRAEDVRNGAVPPEVDNMLKVSTDGRKAALSMALVGGDHQPGKIEGAADRITRIWQQNKGAIYSNPDTGEDDETPGGLQIVFLDMGTPGSGSKTADDSEAALDDLLGGSGWNGYDTLKAELVARGMPAESIRYIHEAKNDAQKAELFAAARNGRISVLIGSSEKMGVGTNMQRRAIALHDLDAPWRPADVEQRHGRIMRQGNLNPDVEIIRYVTEHSFDAYMWQTLERKAKFINQVMRGTLDVREIEDIGDTAMSYAEVKALATGNPDLLDKAKIDTLLTKLERLSRAHNRTQSNLRADVQRQTLLAAQWDANAAALDAALGRVIPTAGDEFRMSMSGQEFDSRADAAEAFTTTLQNVFVQDRWGDMPERTVASIGGFDVTAQIAFASGGRRNVVLRFEGVPGEITSLDSTEIAGGGRGLISRLENGLSGLEARRDRTLQSAARAREEVALMESRIGAGFAREAELVAARAKSERLAEKMQRDAKRAEGREIPYDPHIDSAEFDDPILGPTNDDVGPPETTTPPSAAPAITGSVPAAEVQEGDRVQFVVREVSGDMGEGTVESARTAGNFRMVSIRDDTGKVYTRAYALDAEVIVMVGGNAPPPPPPASEAAAPATAEESFAKLEEALAAARADDQADGHRFTRERETPDGPVYDLYEWRDGEAVLAYAGRPVDDTRGWLDGVDARIAELVHARMEGRDPAPTVLPELVGA